MSFAARCRRIRRAPPMDMPAERPNSKNFSARWLPLSSTLAEGVFIDKAISKSFGAYVQEMHAHSNRSSKAIGAFSFLIGWKNRRRATIAERKRLAATIGKSGLRTPLAGLRMSSSTYDLQTVSEDETASGRRVNLTTFRRAYRAWGDHE